MKSLVTRLLALALFVAPAATYALKVGEAAPALKLPVLNSDKTRSLSSMRGKVVLVDFWSSWCGSCRQSLPYFEQLQAKLSNESFEMYAINLDDNVNEALAFLSKYPVTYPIVWDESQDSPEQFNVQRMPTSFLLDQEGIVRAIYVEFKKSDIASFEKDIRRLLAQ